MSKEILNELIGLAMIDTTFCNRLLASPHKAALEQGFLLTPEEQEIFCQIKADNIYDFNKQVLEKLSPTSD
ncbi:Os1348 family NHLP clan protein [Dictyobacter kobayashii]|uniref:Nif11 domain-containing protein n=1 Tax=Dictyobacter kobayashii TaxID=2014872 RepID=A0A402ASV0_9CHLR|nr:Os1348 family NHLP clan protein [Dictyobacter kobayashii]GCE22196.1 hypothetical protein KDK_59960 [Dictyobacter kobayashii]